MLPCHLAFYKLMQDKKGSEKKVIYLRTFQVQKYHKIHIFQTPEEAQGTGWKADSHG